MHVGALVGVGFWENGVVLAFFSSSLGRKNNIRAAGRKSYRCISLPVNGSSSGNVFVRFSARGGANILFAEVIVTGMYLIALWISIAEKA